jgi:hypothetical protein
VHSSNSNNYPSYTLAKVAMRSGLFIIDSDLGQRPSYFFLGAPVACKFDDMNLAQLLAPMRAALGDLPFPLSLDT